MLHSCCVLPGPETHRENNNNKKKGKLLPVITVAFRKWASQPLPVPGGGGGGYTGTIFEFNMASSQEKQNMKQVFKTCLSERHESSADNVVDD